MFSKLQVLKQRERCLILVRRQYCEFLFPSSSVPVEGAASRKLGSRNFFSLHPMSLNDLKIYFLSNVSFGRTREMRIEHKSNHRVTYFEIVWVIPFIMNCFFLQKAPIQEENKCWKINVTIDYGTTSVNNVSITRNQALSVMKKFAGTARAGLYLCRDVTVKLRDVQVTRGINVTSIMGVFHLVPKLPASKSLSSSAISCVKGAGVFMDLKAQPGRNAPKLFGVHSATGAVVTYHLKGLCCADGLVESNGICGE